MKAIQKGFTLIELMIVIAIIAILAAIALPAYQDYLARSQVSEAMLLSDGAKTAVAETFANTGVFPGIDNAAAGLKPPASIAGSYVSSVTVTDGTITALMGGTKVSGKVTGGVVAFKPADAGGTIKWDCTSGAGTTVGPTYLPKACR